MKMRWKMALLNILLTISIGASGQITTQNVTCDINEPVATTSIELS